MPSPQGPLLPRRRLGAELKRLRGERTLDEVARETLISTSKLSRLENGQGVPQPRDIRDLTNFYGADRATSDRLRRWMNEGRRQAWWKEYSDVVSETVDVGLDFESGASVIRTYSALALPGLVQTAAYARRLLATIFSQRAPEQIDKLVEVRMRRQQILLVDSDDAPRLLALIDEAAVRRALATGTPEEGRAQLTHLREITRRPNVSLRVLPLDIGVHAGVRGPFTVYQFSDDIDRDVVHVETRTGDRYLEEGSSVLDHLRLFDSLTSRAYDTPRTRDLLTRLAEAPREDQEKT
jgi:transcriptional regulator with XRE-family HTH domain